MSWSPMNASDASDDAVIGDEPYDLVSECFRQVVRSYQRDWKRKPSLRELVGTVQAVLDAQLQDHTSDGETAELISLSFKTRKIPRRQKYTVGDVLRAKAANGKAIYAHFRDRCGAGPFVGVYDSLGMSQTDVDAIIQRRLVVKVFPTHRETLEMREWLVIGNRPLTAADAHLPRGPLRIAGTNQQLQAANYYYGLAPASFRNIEEFIIRTCDGA